jgi:hypothetical protein
VNYSTEFASIRDQVSAQEWQARTGGLLSPGRLLRHDRSDLQPHHRAHPRHRPPFDQSLRPPIQGDHGIEPGQDRPRRLHRLEAGDRLRHHAIHKARPDVACVLHTHTRAGRGRGAPAAEREFWTLTAPSFNSAPCYRQQPRGRLCRALPAVASQSPAERSWLHEIKRDGFRISRAMLLGHLCEGQ